MIESFIFTLVALLFFGSALSLKIVFNYKKGMRTSSCHQFGGNQNCECSSQEEEEKKLLKKNVLKRARALSAS